MKNFSGSPKPGLKTDCAELKVGEPWDSPQEFAIDIGKIHKDGLFYKSSVAALYLYPEHPIKSCSHLDTSFAAVAAIQKEQPPQDTDPSGQLKTTPTPQPSTENDSQVPNSSNKTSPDSLTNLSEASTVSISSLGVAHARISALLANAPGLEELADNCFLNTSDFLKSSSLQLFAGNKFQQSYQVEMDLTSSKSLMRLQRWGMWGIGKCETETDTSPKTENDYSVWVFTGDIRAILPKIGKKSLSDILGAISASCAADIAVNSATKEPIGEAFTLRASSPKAGCSTQSHPNTFVLQPAVLDIHHASGSRLYENVAPCLLSPGDGGRKLIIVYRAAGGDRLYDQEAPTLRSLSSTGNHQSGNGAYKVREYQGETYLERPINATEAEQLMGWEVGSTAIGINKEGDEISISQTQRIKMLGNGIIPSEITDILTAIKPILERKLESEVPKNMRFAYRQLRQRGMSHNGAKTILHS